MPRLGVPSEVKLMCHCLYMPMSCLGVPSEVNLLSSKINSSKDYFYSFTINYMTEVIISGNPGKMCYFILIL